MLICKLRDMLELHRLPSTGVGTSTSAPRVPGLGWLMLLRLLFRGDLGRLVVILALLTLRKLELAALRNGVGNDLKNRWEYGNEFAGRDS